MRDDIASVMHEAMMEQTLGLAQLLAALVLTEDEAVAHVQARDSQARAENVRSWHQEMRRDIEDQRGRVVEMLGRIDFHTNTHIGFPLASLEHNCHLRFYDLLLDISRYADRVEAGEEPPPIDEYLAGRKDEYGRTYSAEMIEWGTRWARAPLAFAGVRGMFRSHWEAGP